MILKSIALQNFRNFNKDTFFFDRKVNVILGSNGVGKSNILESIYLVGIGKSFREANNSEIIKFDKDWARVYADFWDDDYNVQLNISSNGDKEVFINGVRLQRLSELIGNICETFIGPAEINLVKGAPNVRRRMLNIHLSQLDYEYLDSLKSYRKVLANKNSALKQIRDERVKEGRMLLLTLNEQLVNYGATIIRKRNSLISALNRSASRLHDKFSQEGKELKLEYRSDISFSNINEIEDIFGKQLNRKMREEIEYGYTKCGPHRDDIGFILDDLEVDTFCSWGQARTISIAVLLSLAELLAQKYSVVPIILLDDCFAELDDERTQVLLDIAPEIGQVFLTSPKEIALPYDNAKILNLN